MPETTKQRMHRLKREYTFSKRHTIRPPEGMGVWYAQTNIDKKGMYVEYQFYKPKKAVSVTRHVRGKRKTLVTAHSRNKPQRKMWIPLSAWGNWYRSVPRGKAGVLMGYVGRDAKGNIPKRTMYILVPNKEYHAVPIGQYRLTTAQIKKYPKFEI